ncbi:MAG: tetratricopeptide repeat protein [Sphingobacteriaceae bacterium]|nr:tetratricopeptide repeat protein [Cytophagaceae bacterium]
MKKILLVFGVIFSIFSPSSAQLQIDSAAQNLVLQSVEKIYNYEFVEAPALIARLRTRYPQHPVAPTLQALQLYWQYLPLSKHPTATRQYVATVNQAIDLAEKLLSTGKYDDEANFFLLTAHSFLAMQQSDAGEFMKAVGEARRAYAYLKKGFNRMDKNPEFYFSTGLYNYYRVQYPENHGIVKPLMLFFASGDKKVGLQQLEMGVKKGNFTRYEAAYYLTYDLIKHENQPARALPFSTLLYEKFPRNPLFTARHAEALVFTGHYAEAEPIAERLMQTSGLVPSLAGTVLTGIVQEKFRKNDKAATVLYQKVLKTPSGERFTKDYVGMAWLGLGRISQRAGDRAKAREHFRQALKLSEYRSTVEEARKALKDV